MALFKRHSKAAEDQLQEYKELIDKAHRFRDNTGIERHWVRMLDAYAGVKPERKTGDNEDRIKINVAKSVIDTMVPSLALNHPQLTAHAELEEMQPNAEANEDLLNYQARHYNYRYEHAAVLLDRLTMGIGWAKHGWRYVEEEVPRSEEEMAAEFDAMRMQVDEAIAMGGDPAAMPTDEQISEGIPATKIATVADHPFVERVSPFDVFVDPTALRMKDVRWIAQRIYLPLEDVQADPRYDAVARKELEATGYTSHTALNDPRYPFLPSATSEDESKITCIWEFYDIRRGRFCVFGDGGKRFLLKPIAQPYQFLGQLDGIGIGPFEPMLGDVVPERLYPMGVLETMLDLQDELDKTRSQLMNHRKKYGRKYLYRKGALSTQALSDLRSNRDNIMVPVDDDTPLGEVIVPIQEIPVPPELYQARDQILDDIMIVTGKNDYQLGIQSERRRTATESSIINDVANSRAEFMRDDFEMFVSRSYSKVMQLNQQFMTQDTVVRILGPDGAAAWRTVAPDDIQGKFDLSVEVGSMAPMNSAQKRRQTMDFVQASMPFIQMGVANPTEVYVELCKHGFERKDVTRFVSIPMPIAPQAMGGPQGPGGPPQGGDKKEPTPREAASEGQSPQMAQLEGQVGLNVGMESPDGPVA